MKKSVKKVLIGSGLAVGTLVAAGAWSYVITKKLVEIALERKEDETVAESKKYIAGNPETSAFIKVQENAAEKEKDCIIVTHGFFMHTLLSQMKHQAFKISHTKLSYSNGEFVIAER